MCLMGPFCDRFSIELWQSNYHCELKKNENATKLMRNRSKHLWTVWSAEKTRVAKPWLISVLHPICREDGVSFLDQSQGKMNQHRRTPPTRLRWTEALDTALKTALLLIFTTNLQEIRMGLITIE